jgi:hypothetical protein
MTNVGGAEVRGADPITERERLAGHHLTHIDSHDDQALIDLQSAARTAAAGSSKAGSPTPTLGGNR